MVEAKSEDDLYQDLTLKNARGDDEIDFSRDPDGDMYIQITEGRVRQSKATIYLTRAATQQLLTWLKKVAR